MILTWNNNFHVCFGWEILDTINVTAPSACLQCQAPPQQVAVPSSVLVEWRLLLPSICWKGGGGPSSFPPSSIMSRAVGRPGRGPFIQGHVWFQICPPPLGRHGTAVITDILWTKAAFPQCRREEEATSDFPIVWVRKGQKQLPYSARVNTDNSFCMVAGAVKTFAHSAKNPCSVLMWVY